MKRKILSIASVIALTAPIQSVAFAHEDDGQVEPPMHVSRLNPNYMLEKHHIH